MNERATSRIGKFRWVILALLFIETVLNYTDLQTLSVLAPELEKKIGLDENAYSMVLEVFLVTYLVSFMMGGWVLDKLGVRKGMALALTWWSLAEIAHGFVHNPTQLAICRGLFGFAYPGAYLAAAKAVSEWYPARERALGTAAYTAGATVGATIAPPLIAALTLSFGWRYSFILAGLAGLVYLALWLALYRAPEEHKMLGETERAYILAGRSEGVETTEDTERLGLGYILSRRKFWGVALGRAIGDNPWIFFVLFVPTFLNSAHGWSLASVGRYLWIPFVFADIGTVGSGWLSGYLVKRGMPVLRARLLLAGIAVVILTLQFTLGYVTGLAGIIATLCVMMMCATTWLVNVGTIPVDVFPKRIVARVVGLCTVGSIAGSLVFVPFVGRMLKAGNYHLLFGVMSVLPIAAFVVLRALIGKTTSEDKAAG